MIHLSYLDYVAVEGKSLVHTLKPAIKVGAVFLVLLGIVMIRTLPLLLSIYILLISVFIASRIPLKIFPLTLYPLFFGFFFIFISDLQIHFIAIVFLKILCGSTAAVTLLSTTPYPSIFLVLSKFMPPTFVTALFLTYRSIFVLMKTFEEVRNALYLRGGIRWRSPLRSLRNISNAFAYLIIKAIDSSDRMYDAMTIRGFEGRMHTGRK